MEIPHLIHCCWFGGRLTPLAARCLESWRRFAPDFEIRLRSEADLPETPPFVRAALAARQWAMASDWFRMYVLAREGGVYFDLDEELVAPGLDALVASGEWIAGEWCRTGGVWPAAGAGLALAKGSPVACAMLEAYDNLPFDPRREMMPWINDRLSEATASHPVRILDPEILCPVDPRGRLRRTERTIGLHHYAMSWATPKRRFARWLNWHGLSPVVAAFLRLRRGRDL